jgi:hypothetical protein
MSYYRIILLFAIATITFGSARFCLAEVKPPEVFVETGICPGEYCRYGLHYIANKDVETYNKPNGIITGSINPSLTHHLKSYYIPAIYKPKKIVLALQTLVFH